jgi:hypothetical protein
MNAVYLQVTGYPGHIGSGVEWNWLTENNTDRGKN